jgi:hypothetical protein
MSNLSVSELWVLIDAWSVLDKAEEIVRQFGQGGTARVLGKFQQDIGVALARQNDPGYDPKAGPRTEKLEQEFSPVMRARLALLHHNIRPLLRGNLEDEFRELFTRLEDAARREAPVVAEPRRKAN